MKQFILIPAMLFIITTCALSQTITSTSLGGPWHDASTWVNGIVPTAANSGKIIINGNVVIEQTAYSEAAPLVIDQLEVSSASLTIGENAYVVVSESIVVSALAYLNMKGNMEIKSNVSVSGTIQSTGVITFSGTTILTGTGLKTFHTVVITGSLTPNSVYTITGDLTLKDNGIIFPGANTTYFTGTELFFTNNGTGDAVFNNVTITEGSKLTTNSAFSANDVIVSGTLLANSGFYIEDAMSISVDTGVVVVNNLPFTIGGTLTVSKGASFTANIGADAVLLGNISASGELMLSSTTYIRDTTVMTGAGTKIFKDIIVSGSFKPNATHTVTGDFTLTGSGVLLEGTSTTTFSGIASEFKNSGTGSAVFNNILIAAGGELRNASPLISNGTFRAAGSFIALNNFTVTGTLTIARTGSLTTDGANELVIGGNLTISGLFNAGCPTRFNGATKITGAGTKVFNDVIIEGTVMSYSGVITITGDLVNNGVFLHNNGTVVFSGDTEKTISSSSELQALIFNNIILRGGAANNDLVLETSVSLTGVLTLENAVGSPFIDTDGASNNKTFTLLSSNDNPAIDASIAALPDDAVVNGLITVQRYLSGEGKIYRYISSPVHGPGATVAAWQNSFAITGSFNDPSDPGEVCGRQVQSHNPSLFYYDEAKKSYTPYPASGFANENLLEVGRGYAAYIRNCIDSTVLSVSGAIEQGVNRGRVNLPVTHTDSVTTFNNLVGNPFPSAFDWNKASLTNVSPVIAIRDNGSGKFRYYTQGVTGAGDVANGVVAQGQAFWIRTTGANSILTIDESSKTASNATTANVFYRIQSDTLSTDMLKITITNEATGEQDHAYLLLNERSGNLSPLDKFDAPKLNNQHDDPFEELIDLYTTFDSTSAPLAVNSFASVKNNSRMTLAAKDCKPGNYVFDFSAYGKFAAIRVSVFDRLTNKTSKTNDGPVKFSITSDSGSMSLQRFYLIFETPVIFKTEHNLSAYPNPVIDYLTIESDSGSIPNQMTLLDFHYRSVTPVPSVTLSIGRVLLDLSAFPSGLYFVQFGEAEKKRILRIVKK